MDQREPPRINPAEGLTREPIADARVVRRFPRLVAPPTVRRLAPSRLALAAVGILVAVGLLLAVLVQIWTRVGHFVHAQAGYQVRFRDITLAPGPPPWYRGGAAAFLEQVAAEDQEPPSFSTLDVDLARLRLSFQRYAWVEKAERAEVQQGAPGRVVVRLVYREPVAMTRGDEVVIDREGVILPRKDLDRPAAEPLLILRDFGRPAGARNGEVWSRAEPGTGLTTPDEQVQDAAQLAAFLRGRLIAEAKTGNLLPTMMIVRWRENGLALQVGPNLMVRWKEPNDAIDELRRTDDTKWAMLLDYLRRSPPKAGAPPLSLKFIGQGVATFPLPDAPGSAP